MEILTAIILFCQVGVGYPSNALNIKRWERNCVSQLIACMGKSKSSTKFNQCINGVSVSGYSESKPSKTKGGS